MPTTTEAYAILGLRHGASLAEVRAAYKRAARVHHPDKGGVISKFLASTAAHAALVRGDGLAGGYGGKTGWLGDEIVEVPRTHIPGLSFLP